MGPPPRHPPNGGHVDLSDDDITRSPSYSYDKQHQLIIHSQLLVASLPPAPSSPAIDTALPPTLSPPATAAAFPPTLPPATTPPLPPPPPAVSPLPPLPAPSSKSPQSSDQGKKIGKIRIKIPPAPPVFTNLLPGEGSNTKNKNKKKKDGPRFCWPCQLWFKCGKALGGHRRHRHPKQIILALPAPNAPILALPAPPCSPPPQAPSRAFAPPEEDLITSSPPSSKHQESNLLTDSSSSSTITQEQELEDPDLQDVAQTLLDFSAGSGLVILGKRPLLEIDETDDLEHNINDYKMRMKHMHKKMRQQFITLSTNRTIPDWDLLFPIQQHDLIHPPPTVSGPVAPIEFQPSPITSRKQEEEEVVESMDAQNLELELATGVRNNSKEGMDLNQLHCLISCDHQHLQVNNVQGR